MPVPLPCVADDVPTEELPDGIALKAQSISPPLPLVIAPRYPVAEGFEAPGTMDPTTVFEIEASEGVDEAMPFTAYSDSDESSRTPVTSGHDTEVVAEAFESHTMSNGVPSSDAPLTTLTPAR